MKRMIRRSKEARLGDRKGLERDQRGTMAESLRTSPHASLRFIPTLHEVGLRRNPSTVSNCMEETLGQLGMRG